MTRCTLSFMPYIVIILLNIIGIGYGSQNIKGIMVPCESFSRLGRASPTDMHEVIFAIKQKNLDILDKTLMERSTPGSPLYQKWLSFYEVGEITSNTEGATMVKDWLAKNNVSIIDETKRQEYIIAKAPVSKWEQLFSTQFSKYQDNSKTGTSDKNVYIRADSYSLPADIHPHVQVVFRTVQVPTPSVKRLFGDDAVDRERALMGDSFDATQHRSLASTVPPYVTDITFLRSFYGIPANGGNNLTSQSVFATNQGADPRPLYSNLDLNTYQKNYNLAIQNAIEYGNGSSEVTICNKAQCSVGNAQLQTIMAVGQRAITYFDYEYTSAGTVADADPYERWLVEISNMTNPSWANIIAYGSNEIDTNPDIMDAWNAEALKLSLTGVTIITGASDYGVAGFHCDCSASSSSSAFIAKWRQSGGTNNTWTGSGYMPFFPASSPYVTTVGGTQRPTNAATESEVIWQCNVDSASGTTGGGFSAYFARPSWQDSAVNNYFKVIQTQPAPGYNKLGRAYPDISLFAANFPYVVDRTTYYASSTQAFSISVLAGYVSLVNSKRLLKRLSPIGFLNPTLYSANASHFNDFKEGSNKCCQAMFGCCTSGYEAASGWDPVSGHGSMSYPQFENIFAPSSYTPPPTAKPTHSPTSSSTIKPTDPNFLTPTPHPTFEPTIMPAALIPAIPSSTPSTFPTSYAPSASMKALNDIKFQSSADETKQRVVLSQSLILPGAIVAGIAAAVYVHVMRKKIPDVLELPLLTSLTSIPVSFFGLASHAMLAVNMLSSESSDSGSVALAIILIFSLLCMMGVGIYLVWKVLSATPTGLANYLVKHQSHDNKNYYSIVFISMCIGTGNIIFLPWNAAIQNSDFVRRSNGFPKFWVMRLSLYSQLFLSLVLLLIAVANAALYANISSPVSTPVFTSIASSALSVIQCLLGVLISLMIEHVHKYDTVILTRKEDNVKSMEVELSIGNPLGETTDVPHKVLEEVMIQGNENDNNNGQVSTENNGEGENESDEFETDERGLRFSTQVRYADKNINLLKSQLERAGKKPLEYIPLPELKAEIAALTNAAAEGLPYDEGRLEHLYACLEYSDEYRAEQAVERRKWRAEISDYANECLVIMKEYVPPHVFKSTTNSLVEVDGVSMEVAKRILRKQCLWLVRVSKADIARIHEADFTKRFAHEGQNLDIVELAALYAAMPETFPSINKENWRLSLEQNLKAMWRSLQAKTLPSAKQRNPAYKVQSGRFKLRDSLHEFNALAAGDVNKVRDSFRSIRALSSSSDSENSNISPSSSIRDRFLSSSKSQFQDSPSVESVRYLSQESIPEIKKGGDSDNSINMLQAESQRRNSVKGSEFSHILEKLLSGGKKVRIGKDGGNCNTTISPFYNDDELNSAFADPKGPK